MSERAQAVLVVTTALILCVMWLLVLFAPRHITAAYWAVVMWFIALGIYLVLRHFN